MSQMPIDIDAEAIFFDGHWYTRDDMARRIKAMLDQGDFAVTRPSQALEQLTQVVSSVRTLAFRATPDMIESINAGAARAGKSVGAFIRDALSQQLGLPSSDFGPANLEPGQPASPGQSQLQTPAARPADETIRGTPVQLVVPNPSPSAPVAPIAGPGAMRAAANERLPSVVVEGDLAEPAVELTNKKTKEEEATERRWFNS
ncbi:MAG: ribbon-helix-helix protein, CopG family [Archangiaceae bacterium]|nr:ribbon-helix-helix protein, CopG family [Archangiaceae bacterium]